MNGREQVAALLSMSAKRGFSVTPSKTGIEAASRQASIALAAIPTATTPLQFAFKLADAARQARTYNERISPPSIRMF
ncbi:hypothetical protein [Variovorax sp. J31P207]|uniref:hypothetical protein n=1 Tax=Variovorax sp. J31P207 TaxID=3053510 RepID=UPI002575D889|nr:hypothetical protein [Variovorax sp. J31P207]MDM0065030.1 hypothetical protein [Variovorax sp. J31P207]